jgi:hypothetical protein
MEECFYWHCPHNRQALHRLQGPGVVAVPQYRAGYVHSNLLGKQQQLQVTASGHRWHDRCFEVNWTDPWLRASSEQRRLSQTVAAALERSDEVPIFGLVDDDGDIMAPGSLPLPQGQQGAPAPAEELHQPVAGVPVGAVLLERAGLGITRRGNLSRRVHGSIGAPPHAWLYW